MSLAKEAPFHDAADTVLYEPLPSLAEARFITKIDFRLDVVSPTGCLVSLFLQDRFSLFSSRLGPCLRCPLSLCEARNHPFSLPEADLKTFLPTRRAKIGRFRKDREPVGSIPLPFQRVLLFPLRRTNSFPASKAMLPFLP